MLMVSKIVVVSTGLRQSKRGYYETQRGPIRLAQTCAHYYNPGHRRGGESMAELIYPTSLTWEGPWLLGSEKLNLLDEILDEFWPQLKERGGDPFKREVESRVAELLAQGREATREEVEKEISWRRPKYSKTLTLYLETGKSLEVDSFKEALLHPQVQTELADGFRAAIESGELKAEVRLGLWMSIEVSPAKDALAVALFGALSNWAASSTPSKWLRRWRGLSGIQWMAYFFLVVILLGVVAENPGKKSAQAEAVKLIQDGVSSSNQPKALETLLKLAVSPDAVNPHIPAWLYFLAFGGLALCVLLSFRPPAVILGIGAGEKRLRRWKTWLKVVFVVVPAFVFTNVLWPLIASRFLPH
jgi:hypothetical protein